MPKTSTHIIFISIILLFVSCKSRNKITLNGGDPNLSLYHTEENLITKESLSVKTSEIYELMMYPTALIIVDKNVPEHNQIITSDLPQKIFESYSILKFDKVNSNISNYSKEIQILTGSDLVPIGKFFEAETDEPKLKIHSLAKQNSSMFEQLSIPELGSQNIYLLREDQIKKFFTDLSKTDNLGDFNLYFLSSKNFIKFCQGQFWANDTEIENIQHYKNIDNFDYISSSQELLETVKNKLGEEANNFDFPPHTHKPYFNVQKKYSRILNNKDWEIREEEDKVRRKYRNNEQDTIIIEEDILTKDHFTLFTMDDNIISLYKMVYSDPGIEQEIKVIKEKLQNDDYKHGDILEFEKLKSVEFNFIPNGINPLEKEPQKIKVQLKKNLTQNANGLSVKNYSFEFSQNTLTNNFLSEIADFNFDKESKIINFEQAKILHQHILDELDGLRFKFDWN